MPDEVRLVGAFALSLTTTLALTPLAIAVATRSDFHDRPFAYKQHAAPTPYLGGAAVVVGFLFGALLTGPAVAKFAPIVLCMLGLLAIGTLDDRIATPVTLRVAAEALAGLVLWAAGLGWSIFDAESLNLLVTIAWTVGLVNAFNLVDNADGAAGTVGCVTALTIAALAIIEGDAGLAAIALGLAGACFGFLRYNLTQPARIFLGDGGSLPIGFALAATIMVLPSENETGVPVLLAAVLLAGLPVLDTILVVASRRRRGLPVFEGGRDHLAHRMVGRIQSPRRIALLLGLIQAMLGLIAIGVVQLGDGSVVAAICVWFSVCAVVVGFLESRSEPTGAGVRPRAPGGRAAASIARALGADGESGASLLELVLVSLLALLCGLSPLASGFYDLSLWGPITLALLAVLIGLVIARHAIPRRSALAAVGGLLALWVWSLASSSWAESGEQALVGANRWLFYAALLAILVLLLRSDLLSRLLLGIVTAAVLAIGAYVAIRLSVGAGEALMFDGRLHEPLGTINGEAGYLLLGVWPLVALAERCSRRWLAAAGVGGVALLASLIMLTQSRAALIALGVSLLIVLAIVPGRLRRALILLLALGVVAIEAPLLLEIYDSTDGGERAASGNALRVAGVVAILGAGAVATLWALGEQLVSARSAAVRGQLASIAAWGLAGGAALVVVAAFAVADPVGRADRQLDEFTSLSSDDGGASRLTSGGGNRYDYWRVAYRQFEDDPLAGVGAGNYDRTYFLERRTDEDVRQPHSLPIQTLAELGLVGIAALLLFLAGAIAGIVRRLRATSGSELGLVVAAGGAFAAWATHTSFDWLHLLPGVTGVALGSVAVLVSPSRPAPERAGPGWLRRAAVAAVVLACIAGAVLVGRATLAEHYRENAREQVSSDPAEALSTIEDGLTLSGESLDSLYVKAAAFARLDEYGAAQATLTEATRLEPHDFVPWALRGDLAARRDDIAAARRYYSRAAQLNPRDEQLRRLADDPAARPEP